MLDSAVEGGLFVGVDLPGFLAFSHILFANDILVFGRATESNIVNIWVLLRLFSKLSRLIINSKKFSYVPFNERGGTPSFVSTLLGCRIGELPIKYLGLPLHRGVTWDLF
jgi:hypothetical protein